MEKVRPRKTRLGVDFKCDDQGESHGGGACGQKEKDEAKHSGYGDGKGTGPAVEAGLTFGRNSGASRDGQSTPSGKRKVGGLRSQWRSGQTQESFIAIVKTWAFTGNAVGIIAGL